MKNSYLKYIPRPLLNDIVDNRVVPFVGAGFSKNADIPSDISMPDWNELGKLVAEELSDFTYDNNAIEALSYYEEKFSRNKLIEFLMRALHVDLIKPGETYKAFCKLFTGTICTTNFDFLLEDAMKELHQPISTIISAERLSVNANRENRLIKLHGDFNHPEQMVITENDYDLYLERNPIISTYISNLFITNTMLLLGYSFDDDDFRGIWQIINSRLGKMGQPAYCIMVNANMATIAKFKRRNVYVINLPGEAKNYKSILQKLFDEIREYKAEQKDKTAKSTNEKVNEQMIIPAENNRLCFISCSTNRIARLSSLINPILLNMGITPVRLDEMLMPGDNWTDTVVTIVRKCKFAIVDISDFTPNVSFEYGLLKSLDSKVQTILIRERAMNDPLIPFDILNEKIIYYTFDYEDDDKGSSFINELKKSFGINIESNLNNDNLKNAYRLFEKKEYSAAIVSAFSELEYKLSICSYPVSVYYKGSFMQKLRQMALEKSIIINIDILNSSYYTRNKIVHESYSTNRKEAEKVLDFIKDILNQLDSFNMDTKKPPNPFERSEQP